MVTLRHRAATSAPQQAYGNAGGNNNFSQERKDVNCLGGTPRNASYSGVRLRQTLDAGYWECGLASYVSLHSNRAERHDRRN
jgi:hypothetical protein